MEGLDIEKLCAWRCPLSDCFREIYQFREIMNVVHGTNQSTIFISLPSDPDYIYTHHPSMELVEYLCYLGGVIGLWFGLSILITLESLLKVVM